MTKINTRQLAGGVANPGNDKLYGTDGTGNPGFYDQGSGGKLNQTYSHPSAMVTIDQSQIHTIAPNVAIVDGTIIYNGTPAINIPQEDISPGHMRVVTLVEKSDGVTATHEIIVGDEIDLALPITPGFWNVIDEGVVLYNIGFINLGVSTETIGTGDGFLLSSFSGKEGSNYAVSNYPVVFYSSGVNGFRILLDCLVRYGSAAEFIAAGEDVNMGKINGYIIQDGGTYPLVVSLIDGILEGLPVDSQGGFDIAIILLENNTGGDFEIGLDDISLLDVSIYQLIPGVYKGSRLDETSLNNSLVLPLDGDTAHFGGILYYYNGTDWVSFSCCMQWNVITADENAIENNGYIVNGAGTIEITLPVTCAVGQKIEIVGSEAAGREVAQNAGQEIDFGLSTSTAGTSGGINSTAQKDSVVLVCTVVDTKFQVVSAVGSINVF